MAKSPAHKFGQSIGGLLEAAVERILIPISNENNLFLDKKGKRPARKGKKVAWKDMFGNIHDLDFVLEKDGTSDRIGTPIAFIESAWRRYTKHSRNKAQEIQGAILPLIDTHKLSCPFVGVVIGGVFTGGAIAQLKSIGFSVLYFPYNSIIKSFETVKIDATFDEDTPDSAFSKKIKAYSKLNGQQKEKIIKKLLELNNDSVNAFLQDLKDAVQRQVKEIFILPLHGNQTKLDNVQDAIEYITQYRNLKKSITFVKYEILLKFNNNDRIEASFQNKETAISFLKQFDTMNFQLVNKK
ncbi:DNA methylase [bacterium]|nr:DNA methylase [bacterium]